MEKLKKYNQILLATFGTLAVIGLSSALLIGLFGMLSKWTNNNDWDNNQNDLIVDNIVDSSSTKLKTQDLTFSLPILLDTIPEIYVIPVSQVSLSNPETYEVESEPFSRSSYKKTSYRRNGNFNNLIIFDGIKNEKFPIFKRKVDITSYQYFQFKDSKYILIIGGAKDTNKDNKLNNSDLKSFYVYDLTSQKLNEFNVEKFGLISYDILNDKNEIILQYGNDKNDNGEFNSYEEPNILKQLSLSSMKFTDFIDSELKNKIQSNIK